MISVFLIFVAFFHCFFCANIYDATLSVDSSSGCPIIPSFFPQKSNQPANCDSLDTQIAAPPIEPCRPKEASQPLRLLTMVSRIPLPPNNSCQCESQPEPSSQCEKALSKPIGEPKSLCEVCEKTSSKSFLEPKQACESTPNPTTTQKICPCVSVYPESTTTANASGNKVYLRRGKTGKIVTKANHIAPIERVSVSYEVETLAVPTTLTVVRTDYVPYTHTKTNVQTYGWTTFTVDDVGDKCASSASAIKPTTATCPSSLVPNIQQISSSTKECQLATLCKKKKAKLTTSEPETETLENEF